MMSSIGSKRRGFTLLELLVVMVIIGVLVGMVTPYLRSSYSHMELRDSARTLLALMRHAQQRAMFEVRRYRISFDTETHSRWETSDGLNTYWLSREEDEDGSFELVSTSLGEKERLPGAVTISQLRTVGGGDVTSVTFYPSGMVDAVELDLTGDGQVIRLQTLPKIQEVPPEED